MTLRLFKCDDEANHGDHVANDYVSQITWQDNTHETLNSCFKQHIIIFV